MTGRVTTELHTEEEEEEEERYPFWVFGLISCPFLCHKPDFVIYGS